MSDKKELKPGQVRCQKCGVIIEVSKLDYAHGNVPKLCPQCKRKPQKGTFETLGESMKKDEYQTETEEETTDKKKK